MENTQVVIIQRKYKNLQNRLNERTRRLWAATEAAAIGRGGITSVHQATGIDIKTIRKGLCELNAPNDSDIPCHRSRIGGGGRKKITEHYPEIKHDLDTLIDPVMRGDPESPLRWTCKSTRLLADELNRQNYGVSPSKVRQLLAEMEYSLQGNQKTRDGADHPDRNEQFLHIYRQIKKFLNKDQPVISVDTKKKRCLCAGLGNLSNKGREWCHKGKPLETKMHAPERQYSPDKKLGKAIPYGVYDIGRNEGWVNVGITSDTAQFAVASIRRWWTRMGHYRFPNAKQLLITADAGGSNGYKTKLWKVELQNLANFMGVDITVCHFPPGTSKWNKIEHRLFSFISQNWRGKPLYDLATVVNLISNTATREGLTVKCAVDTRIYKTGIEVSDTELASVKLKPDKFHSEWNYTVKK